MESGELKREFGLRVRELREARGLTQEELADLIGRSSDTIGNIERGVNVTRIETALKIAQAVGVSLSELFVFDAPMPRDRDKRRTLRQLLNLLSDCDQRTVSLIIEIVERALKLRTL